MENIIEIIDEYLEYNEPLNITEVLDELHFLKGVNYDS